MDLVYTITHSSRIHDLLFCRDNNRNENDGQLLLVGAEDRKVSVYRIYSGAHSSSSSVAAQPRVVAEMVGHTNQFVASHDRFFLQRTERFYRRIKRRRNTRDRASSIVEPLVDHDCMYGLL